MMMPKSFSLVLFAAFTLFLSTGSAQEKPRTKDVNPLQGFRGEFLVQLNDVEKKIIGLAEAMPQEKYSWRPGEGVRSVCEVYVHVAGANYLFPSFIGVKAPEGMSRDMEKTITDKTKVMELLKKSFGHMRQTIVQTSDTDLDKPAELFGQKTTVRGVLFNAGLHMHEHLGQSIAYARMNGVIPPWTAERNAREQKGVQK